MAKSNKIEKTEELIVEYQEAECLWNLCSLRRTIVLRNDTLEGSLDRVLFAAEVLLFP